MTTRVAALLAIGWLATDARAQPNTRDLWRISDEKGVARKAETAHRDREGRPLFVNALIREHSPYLLDSAHSPIQWRPWEESALSAARSADRLIFVSIGYSSCHWCQVMARESFDDLDTAEVLNRSFVALKIDSEERPDLDRRFLDRLEAIGVSPGWPMNFVLTPESETIWAATYVKHDELLTTLKRLESRWESDRVRMRRLAAARESQLVSREVPPSAGGSLADSFAREHARIAGAFDPVHKGFGTNSKFHTPAQLEFLYDAFVRGGAEADAFMFVDTLRAIGAGGLYDPIEGGVFRYSTAPDWLEPHFEKMLYDQALVARLMCRGHSMTGDPKLRRAATGIIDFTLKALSAPSGLFASSLDAESDGAEGGYYLASDTDLELLTPEIRSVVARHFRQASQPRGGFLLLPNSSPGEQAPAEALSALRGIRGKRRFPRRDDKAITAWNASMIVALVECGTALEIPRYASEGAARMRTLLAANAPEGSLFRYSIGERPTGPATVEDRAWLLAAMIALYDADGALEWIDRARSIASGLTTVDAAALGPALMDFSKDRDGISGSAVLVRSLSNLARRSEAPVFSQALSRVSAPLRVLAGGEDLYSLTAALYDQDSPVPTPIAYVAGGKVRLQVIPAPSQGPPARFAVVAEIQPGWHINSHVPQQDYLRPTNVVVRGVERYEVSYPEGKPLRFGKGSDVLSVLDGVVRFDVRAFRPSVIRELSLARLSVALQICNTEICLRPETVELAAWPGARR